MSPLVDLPSQGGNWSENPQAKSKDLCYPSLHQIEFSWYDSIYTLGTGQGVRERSRFGMSKEENL